MLAAAGHLTPPRSRGAHGGTLTPRVGRMAARTATRSRVTAPQSVVAHHEHVVSTPLLAVKCCPMVVLLSVRDTTLAAAGPAAAAVVRSQKKKTDQNLVFEGVCRNESTVAEATKYIFVVLKHHQITP